jgi:hypothetical protein
LSVLAVVVVLGFLPDVAFVGLAVVAPSLFAECLMGLGWFLVLAGWLSAVLWMWLWMWMWPSWSWALLLSVLPVLSRSQPGPD